MARINVLQETKQMQSGQNDTTQNEPFAHWRKGHLFRFAVRGENMLHRTMGHLRHRELRASRRSGSVLGDSKKVLWHHGLILE